MNHKFKLALLVVFVLINIMFLMGCDDDLSRRAPRIPPTNNIEPIPVAMDEKCPRGGDGTRFWEPDCNSGNCHNCKLITSENCMHGGQDGCIYSDVPEDDPMKRSDGSKEEQERKRKEEEAKKKKSWWPWGRPGIDPEYLC